MSVVFCERFPSPCPVCGADDDHAERMQPTLEAAARFPVATVCPHPEQPGHGTGCCCAGRSQPSSAPLLKLDTGRMPLLPPKGQGWPPPRCPATTRHAPLCGVGMSGFQCKYEPGHDGDHCAYVGPREPDAFWPQEATTPAEVSP